MSEIVYIPAPEAEALTAALWDLSDPNPTRGTTGLFAVVEALDKSKWLIVCKKTTLPVHDQANLNGIAKLVQPLVENKTLAANTMEVLQVRLDTVKEHRQRLNVFEAMPDEIKAMARDLPAMIEEGLLPAQEPMP